MRGIRMLKAVLQKIFSRMVVTGLAILIQVLWLFFMLYEFSLQYTFANLLLDIAGLLLVIHIIDKPGNVSAKLAWTFVLLLFPIPGIVVYYVFGRPKLTKKTQLAMDHVNRRMERHLEQSRDIMERLREKDVRIYRQAEYIRAWSHFPACENTETNYYPCGEDMFADMLAAIRQAKRFIFLEYFIIDEGRMYDALIQALEEKVKDGVEVRLIYDDVGCLRTLPLHFTERMEQNGVRCAAFNRFRPILNIVMNNRDHRKILIVDGTVGFTGGLNIADEYINEKQRFGYWKDTGIRITGDAVWNFTIMFLEMWDYIKKEQTDCEKYRPEKTKMQERGVVQPYGDTPLDNEKVGETVYLNMICKAKDYIYIYTPYLIIDQEMQATLCNAAKSGVDVRIVTPGIPDKKLIFLLTRSNYRALLDSGVKIYEYTPGFIHAKCFLCDDETAAVGSINLDYRSLYLHFECGVWMYRSKATLQLKEDMLRTFSCSHQIRKEEWRERGLLNGPVVSLLKLFAPLL